MLEREEIMQELWKRMSSVSGVNFTARNPKIEPSVNNLPCIQFFELEDTSEHQQKRGSSTYPAYRRSFRVVIEAFVKGTTEAASSHELSLFMQQLKKKLYEGGISLGGRCELLEIETSRMLRPPSGDNVVGVGLTLQVRYIEDIQRLFV